MKFIGGESFIVNSEKSNVKLSTAIYGNVLNSTGSIIPLMWDAIKNNYPLKLYSPEMTRFMIETDKAVDLIEEGLSLSGYNIIPNISSFKVLDLFQIFSELFGLKYEIGKPRISEKLHEMMFSAEESPRIKMYNNSFIMHYKDVFNESLPFDNFTSDKVMVSKEELNKMLKNHNYFKE